MIQPYFHFHPKLNRLMMPAVIQAWFADFSDEMNYWTDALDNVFLWVNIWHTRVEKVTRQEGPKY